MMTPEEQGFELLAEDENWKLWLSYKDRGWWNLKLIRDIEGSFWVKRNWWFAWNGERISGTRDAHLLRKQQPERADWVLDACRRRLSARTRGSARRQGSGARRPAGKHRR